MLFFNVSTDVLLKIEILNNCKIRELNNSNNNILEEEFALNNKGDHGILDGNIGNLLDDDKHTAFKIVVSLLGKPYANITKYR